MSEIVVTIPAQEFSVGMKIWFEREKRPYTVKACDERYIICTKPFNVYHTVLYTIIDLGKKVRGTENLIFCMGFETDQQCKDALKRLQAGESEVTHRNVIPLDIIKTESKKGTVTLVEVK